MVPVSGPVAQMILLSGDSGSTLASTSSTRYLVPRPREPMKLLAQSMLRGSDLTVPAVKLTRRIFPAQLMFVLLKCWGQSTFAVRRGLTHKFLNCWGQSTFAAQSG